MQDYTYTTVLWGVTRVLLVNRSFRGSHFPRLQEEEKFFHGTLRHKITERRCLHSHRF